MDNPKLWQSMNDTWAALRGRFEPVVSQRCSELNLDLEEWGLLLAVLKFEPEDTAPVDLMVRSPYTAAEVFVSRLQQAAEAGWLAEASPGAYHLTEAGRKICKELIDVARSAMVEANPLSSADSSELASLINRLVQQSLKTPPPPKPWSIRLSYKLMPDFQPEMPFIEQGFSCLGAYRDDAQLASWIRTGKSATALEMLALLWRGEADSLDAICDQLSHRGHECEVYTAVLENLRELGFVNGEDDALCATGAGRVFCNQVEEVTEGYFFTPWSVLDEEHKTRLSHLLTHLGADLKLEQYPMESLKRSWC